MRSLASLAASVACLFAVVPNATAAIYWNSASGTWSTSASIMTWSSDAAGTSAVAWTNGSDAIFSADGISSPSVALGSAVSAASLLFQSSTTITGSSAITVSGGSLTVGENATVSANSSNLALGVNSTFSVGAGASYSVASITGGKTIAYTGPGTLTVLGNMDAVLNMNSGFAIIGGTSNKFKGGTIKSGATLVFNGNTAGATSMINIEGGATYAGRTNYANAGAVSLKAASARVSPGDMTTSGVSSLGTLNINGLSAATGGTFDFDLGGSLSDTIVLGSYGLDLGGNVTFNLNAIDVVDTDAVFTLLTGTGTWNLRSGVAISFATLPEGYTLDASYGNGDGYVVDSASATRTLTVKLAAVPEPAAIGLLCVGGLAMLARRSRR